MQPLYWNLYCFVPVYVKFPFIVTFPVPIKLMFAGITVLLNTGFVEQSIKQFPEPEQAPKLFSRVTLAAFNWYKTELSAVPTYKYPFAIAGVESVYPSNI